jgi:polysaccharide pyruvyl transferase WcaK-like protein
MDVLGEWPLSELTPLISSARNNGKPIIFVGTGTERLLRDESKRVVADVIAPSVLHWSVRCDRDRERLTEYGVSPDRITVAADLAWMLDEEPVNFGRKYLARLGMDLNGFLVGVNVNGEKIMLDREPKLFEKLGIFLDSLIEKYGVHVLFFCNEVREDESFDKAASQKILATMQYQDKAFLIPNYYWSPQGMLSLVGCCSLTISTRYHFCLFSALQNVPFIAIKRSDKVDDLCWDMNWTYGSSLKNMNGSELLDMFSDIVDKRGLLSGRLKNLVPLMREKAFKNNIPLHSLMREVKN